MKYLYLIKYSYFQHHIKIFNHLRSRSNNAHVNCVLPEQNTMRFSIVWFGKVSMYEQTFSGGSQAFLESYHHVIHHEWWDLVSYIKLQSILKLSLSIPVLQSPNELHSHVLHSTSDTVWLRITKGVSRHTEKQWSKPLNHAKKTSCVCMYKNFYAPWQGRDGVAGSEGQKSWWRMWCWNVVCRKPYYYQL